MAVTNSIGAIVVTDAQEADVYFFCGWPQRWVQTNTALEQALRAIAQKPGMLALLTNGITVSPKGLLAQARDLYDVQIPGAYERLMAKQVGTIQLSGHGELNMLAKQGQRLVGAICSILYVKRGDDVFKPGAGNGWQVGGAFPTGAPSGDSGNWVGK